MSEQYQTTRLYDPPTPPAPPDRPRRTWLYGLIGGLVLLLAAGAVGAFFFILPLFQAQRTIPALMGADTQFYASFTPNLSAVPGVQRLQAAYPDLFVDQDTSKADKQLEELLGVNFKDDVQPWLGAEIAIGVSGVKDLPVQDRPSSEQAAEDLAKQARVTIVLAARDRAKAQAFLDKQRTGRGDKGQTFDQSTYKNVTIYEQKDAQHSPLAAFALVRGYVVFASDTASITALIDRESSGKDTLEQNARFKTVLANLPKTAVGYVYLDGPPVADLIDSTLKQTISSMPGSQADQLESQLKNLKAMQGMGLALSVVDEGVQLDSAASFDLSKLDRQMADQIEAARIPVDAAQLQNISDSAVALVTFKIPSTFKDQVMEALKAQPDAEESLKEFEQQTDLSLEHDLLDWLAGDASLVVLPGEKLGDTTIPVTGYFVLRPQDKNAAEAGLKKIAATIEKTLGSEDVRFEQESIAGVDWQVIKEPQSQQSVVGYGFTKDEVVIAFGKTALSAAGGGHEAPIVNEDTFKAVNGKLLSPNGGLFYVNVANAVDIADKLGVGDEDSAEQQAFRKNIKPIKAVGLAAGPGIDKDGLSHGRLFVLIADK